MSEARAWAEVDLSAIQANVRMLASLCAPAGVIAVVKADGYGHGAVPVAAAALDAGAAALGVAIPAEGVELREAGIDARILVLSEPRPTEFHECVSWRLEPAVYTGGGIAAAAAAASDRILPVHLKVDTGMHRVGAPPGEIVRLAKAIAAEPALSLASLWTHCAIADEPDDPFTSEQLARYDEVVAEVEAAGIAVPARHAANSAGALCHPAARYDLVRCGIAIYGIAPAADLADRPGVRELVPALSLKAAVSLVKVVPAGDRISYGLAHRFERDTVVATVPIGYADGVRRRLHAAGGEVLIGGRRREIVGVVTMDQLMVDCGSPTDRSDADGVIPTAGDEAVLIGAQGNERITADDQAALLDTIGYEIVCAIGPRVPRRYL